MHYFIIKRLLLIIFLRKKWFLIPILIIALKITFVHLTTPSEFIVTSNALININLKDPDIEYVPRKTEINQILTELIGQSDQFFRNRLALIPQNLLDRFLIQQRHEQGNKTIAQKERRYKAHALIVNAMTLQMPVPFEPVIIYQGQDEKLGKDLVAFFTSELANYIKLRAVQASYFQERRILGFELGLNRQDKNLANPDLSQNRKQFYEQKKEESRVMLHRLKNQESVKQRISSSVQVAPRETESEKLYTNSFFRLWDLYLFVLLSFVSTVVILLMEFSRQGFTSETQMIRYLKADLIGSIPRVTNPYQPGDESQ